MINTSIIVTNNSQITIYSTPSLINNGSTNRNNGKVIVEAKIQVRINLQLEICSSFRNNFAIINRTIVSITTVRIRAIKNFVSLPAFSNFIPCSVSTISNV